MNEITKKVIAIVLLAVFGLVSLFVISEKATDAQTYAHTIESIDEKKATVMGFTATAAAASTAIAAIPGDASTPIANQIMEISEYLFIVVCFLVLEKSLLTVIGFLAFSVLIPAGCVILAIDVLVRRREIMMFGIRLIVFAIVLAMIIPFSVYISDMIYEANQFTIEEISADFETVEETEPAVSGETVPVETVPAEQSWTDKLKDAFSGAVETVRDTTEEVINQVEDSVTHTTDEAKELLNKFIDAIALFIIAYCAIPVVVVFVVVWLVKFLFQVHVPQKQNKPGKDLVRAAEYAEV